jgi:hypothetical protein
MDAKFLSCEHDRGHKADTGEVWESHELQVLTDEGARTVRVSPEVYASTRSLEQLAPIRIEFGLAKGRFGRHYPVVQAVTKVQAR